MMKCESWRESMQKAVEEMQKTKKPNIDVPKKEEENKTPDINIYKPSIIDPKIKIIKDPYLTYTWKYEKQYGWVYASQEQIDQRQGWIYREDLGWVWRFSENESFIYSEEYGWFFSIYIFDKNILYWYDRRIWMFASDFFWKK